MTIAAYEIMTLRYFPRWDACIWRSKTSILFDLLNARAIEGSKKDAISQVWFEPSIDSLSLTGKGIDNELLKNQLF